MQQVLGNVGSRYILVFRVQLVDLLQYCMHISFNVVFGFLDEMIHIPVETLIVKIIRYCCDVLLDDLQPVTVNESRPPRIRRSPSKSWHVSLQLKDFRSMVF